MIKDHKREEELIRNRLFYSLKLRICYLLITVFKSKSIVILRISKNYRAQKKSTRVHKKSQSATIKKNQEASPHPYTPKSS